MSEKYTWGYRMEKENEMLYKIRCSFDLVVEAKDMETAFIHASKAYIENPSLPKQIVEIDDGYEMEEKE